MEEPESARAETETEVCSMSPIESRRLIGVLRDIEKALSKALEQQKNIVSTNQAAGAKEREPHPDTPLLVVTQRSDSDAVSDKAEQEKERAFQRRSLVVQWWLFGATILAFAAAVWYASIAKETLREIAKQTPEVQKSAKAAMDSGISSSEHFRIDERAYVLPTKIAFPPLEVPQGIPLDQAAAGPRPQPGNRMFVNIYFRNTGRSPAKDVAIDAHLVFGINAQRGCFAFVRPIEPEPGGSVIGAGEMIWVTAPSISNQIKFPTPFINWNGETPILVYAVVKYRDIFNVAHRSKTCAVSLPNGQFQFTPGQSWMDY